MKKDFFLILVLICTSWVNYAQLDFKRMAPPNPNVASLMKASLTPVTEYAGLPSINIPIYTINEDGLQIPISLSYHAGGIQVAEESGIVGLGWALNVGGIITRNINGYADFGESQGLHVNYLYGTAPIPDFILSNDGNGDYFNTRFNQYIGANAQCEFLVNGVLTQFDLPINGEYDPPVDYLPDTYNYSFNGYSGSFIMRRDGSIFSSDKNGIKIEWQSQAGNHNFDFTFITPDGAKYEFKTWAKTNTNISNVDTPPSIYTSSWFLTKITTTNGREVDFTYENRGKSYPIKTFIQRYLSGAEGTGGYTGFKNIAAPQTEIDDIYLTDINFFNGSVKFNYSDPAERQDISTAYFLKNLEISNSLKIIKKHVFNYSYFGSAGGGGSTQIENGDFGALTGNSGNGVSLNLRLRLDSTTQDETKTHSFEYFDAVNVQLTPNKTTMSQDYWGYYNGILNTISFIPYGNPGALSIPIKAKRFPIEVHAKIFSLNKIVYPTKGSTEFDYELNTYDRTFDNVPIITPPPPPATVEKSEFVASFGDGVLQSKIIYPKGDAVILRVDLAIPYSNVAPNSSDPYPNRYNHPIDFFNDIYVKLIRNQDGAESIYHLSSEAPFDFQQNGTAFLCELDAEPCTFDIGTPFNGGYTIEAYYFNHNDLYGGQAKITVTWQEPDLSETEKYSIGGGLRIKSISDKGINGQQLRKRNFNYHYTEYDVQNDIEVENSYGRIKIFPNFYTDYPDRLVTSDGTPYSKEVGEAVSHNSFSKHMGSYVGYRQVEMKYEDINGLDNGKTISKFYDYEDYYGSLNPVSSKASDYRFPPIKLPHNGMLFRQEKYKRLTDGTYIMQHTLDNKYAINGIETNDNSEIETIYTNYFNSIGTDFVMGGLFEFAGGLLGQNNCPNLAFQFYPHYATLVQQVSQKETLYDTNGSNPVITEHTFKYDNNVNYMRTMIETIDSEGNLQTSQTFYPDDIDTPFGHEGGLFTNDAFDAITQFKQFGSHRRIGQPIQTVSINNGKKMILRTNFKDWLPNANNSGNIILQETIQTTKGDVESTDNLEDRISYHRYDDIGNPLEISKATGAHIVYIWGYNRQYPIAEIENAAYADIQAFEINLQSLSNSDIDSSSEDALRAALNNLRIQLPEAMIRTYTYDPLVGVTSVTDPRGYTMFYEYDELNRLIMVRDDENNIVSKNEYNYKTN